MELTKEIIEKAGLNEDQVTVISSFGKDYADNLVAETKKEFEGKANSDAQAILDGAANAIKDKFGIEKQQGEKIADYITRATDQFNKTKVSELEQAKKDYETKIKGVTGSDELKAELEKYKQEKDEILKKYANYDEIAEKAAKADEYHNQLSGLKLNTAFNEVKPSFPDTVNAYEAKAKWDEFKANVLKDWDIELIDNEPVAISKENKHKQVKLKDLVSKDETITELVKGRQQSGTGAKPEKITIDGVPFEVPANATAAERSNAIREYLSKKGLAVTHPDYAKKFAEYNEKIKKQQTA